MYFLARIRCKINLPGMDSGTNNRLTAHSCTGLISFPLFMVFVRTVTRNAVPFITCFVNQNVLQGSDSLNPD